jgi:Prefoldin subunit
MTPSLVLVTLGEQMENDPKRKCFRMIGGVLVERTVEEVVPNLQTNLEGVCLFQTCCSITLTIYIDQTRCSYFSYTIQGQGGRIHQIRQRLQYPSGSCMKQVLILALLSPDVNFCSSRSYIASVSAQPGTAKMPPFVASDVPIVFLPTQSSA